VWLFYFNKMATRFGIKRANTANVRLVTFLIFEEILQADALAQTEPARETMVTAFPEQRLFCVMEPK
jgi:hypothetical protein